MRTIKEIAHHIIVFTHWLADGAAAGVVVESMVALQDVVAGV